jgi:hypothetical protein
MKQGSRRIHLRRRDLALLRSLAEARYLSVQAIEWLHWPSWWQRWERCQQLRAAGAHACYRASDGVYDRLKKLREAELITLVNQRVVLATEFGTRSPIIYTIAQGGLRLLARCDALPLPVATASLSKQPDHITQLRQIEVGRIYAALRAIAEARGGKLTEWRAAHSLPLHPTVDVVVGGQSQRITIAPDATGQIQRLGGHLHRYFIEVVRGIAPRIWQATVLAYEACRQSDTIPMTRYGNAWTVLVFVTDEEQRQRLMDATAQVTACPDRYLFGLISQIHPTRFADGWRRISRSVEARSQRVQVESTEVNLFA